MTETPSESDSPQPANADAPRALATDPSEETSPPRTREELWRRIRGSSRNEVILSEMVRLGFWPAESEDPTATSALMHRIAGLEKELRTFTTEKARLEDRERMLREIRKRRMAESRRKRLETKERRQREREDRAARWRERREREILYLGEGVSAGLGSHGDDHSRQQVNAQRLAEHGLPNLATAADIAAAMDIRLGELRFLAYQRRVSRVHHYRRFAIPKKRGGTRSISAPMPRLKAAQRFIAERILNPVTLHDAAHGFRTGRSIVTNARPHVGQDLVINLDLRDFFPTLTYRRVKGMYRALGYGEEASTIFALLTTEADVDTVSLDGSTYHVQLGDRHLPQGSPASPAISNIVCRRLDRRLHGLAERLGYVYTRYADDLTFSASGEAADRAGKLLRAVTGIVEHEDFAIHEQKTRLMRRGRRQEVTGLTVNDRVSVERAMLRRLRAVLHHIERDGIRGKTWNGRRGGVDEGPGDVLQAVLGYANFVAMVEPEKGAALVQRAQGLITRLGHRLPPSPVYEKRTPSWLLPKKPKGGSSVHAPEASTPGKPKKKPWWKFW